LSNIINSIPLSVVPLNGAHSNLQENYSNPNRKMPIFKHETSPSKLSLSIFYSISCALCFVTIFLPFCFSVKKSERKQNGLFAFSSSKTLEGINVLSHIFYCTHNAVSSYFTEKVVLKLNNIENNC
jgi:hypothetical protein